MAVIQVDLTEPSHTVYVQPGDMVRLCLAETPTTGYRWERLGLLPSGVEEEAADFESGGGMIGAAGRRCFTLRCPLSVDASLTYVLCRAWAPDQIAKRVVIRLICAG